MTDSQYDLLVIGGGPAGTRAALDAVAAGMRTALAEPCFLGGTCLNAGCIPTKFLLGATSALPLVETQKGFKTLEGDLRIHLATLQERKERYVKGVRQALQKRLEAAGIAVLPGKAAFTGPQTATITEPEGKRPVSFQSCIVATGSIPASFPSLRPDGAAVLASSSLLNCREVPESLLIVGGGAIGIELGELFHRLGSRIILAEGADRILPGEDRETSLAMQKHFQREGWELHIGKRIASLVTEDGIAALRFENGEELHAARALVAVGRRPATTGLHPEGAGIGVTDRGWLATDPFLRCAEHVYAVGDINGRILLAHAADHQARYAVRHILNRADNPYSAPAMPGCVYGTMEVMRVGPTVAELIRSGNAVSVSRVPMAANPIAQGYGHTQGFLSMAWAGDILQSVTAVGHHASHLVTVASLLVHEKTVKNRVPDIIFAHPTLDELIESAILAPALVVEEPLPE